MTDKPLLPVVAKFQEAFHVVERMFAENLARQDMAGNLAAEDQEQENRGLARDREQIGVLNDILRGLLAAMLTTIREENYDAICSKLQGALDVQKAMLAEYKQAREILSGLPPERRRQEARGLASAASTLKHGMDSYVLHGKTAPNPTRPSQNQAVTLH
jgi:hypothetical protein